MGDERRSDGSGAVVAIVVILGILGLLGVVAVVGGAMFFVSVRSVDGDMQIRMPPQPVATSALPPDTVELDPLGAPALATPIMTIEVDADNKILLGGSAVTLEELKIKLTELKSGDSDLRVSFVSANEVSNEAPAKAVIDLLKEMNIGFEIEPKQ